MHELTFKQIIQFLAENRRYLAFLSAVGFLVGLSYCLLTPKIYEAFLFISLPQTNQISAEGIVKETIAVPSTLNARRILLNPATITPEMLKTCGLEDTNTDRKKFVNAVYATDVDGGERNLMLLVRIPGKERAEQCVNGIAAELLVLTNAIKNNYILHYDPKNQLVLVNEDAKIYRAARVSDSYILPRPGLTILATTLLGFLAAIFFGWIIRLLKHVK